MVVACGGCFGLDDSFLQLAGLLTLLIPAVARRWLSAGWFDAGRFWVFGGLGLGFGVV